MKLFLANTTKWLFKNRKILLLKAVLLLAWIILVLYPNPGNLVASISRLKNPPVMPMQVSEIARELEGSPPAEIEQYVYSRIPYSYDWEVYNMPWYFPTLEEALLKGSGDCKARFLLFASLLENKDIPYQKNMSLSHIWVNYEGKPETGVENMDESVMVVDDAGNVRLSVPRPDLERAFQNFYKGFWEVMPLKKKILLASGFPIVLGMPTLACRIFLNKPLLSPVSIPEHVKAQ